MNKDVEYHIGLKKGDIGKYVLLPGDPGRVEKIANYFDEAEEAANNREYRTFTGTVDGIKVSATSTGIGCPSTAICVEELTKIGAEVFIRIGTAGSLQKEVGLGDIVISTGAVREEGTTRQYVPLSFPAVSSLEVTNALVKAAEKLGVTSHPGIVHCKDAFYTEGNNELPLAKHNDELWEAWYKSNVLATSMESSALFIISHIKKKLAGEVLAIIGKTYENKPIEKKVGVDEAIQTAIEAVKILDKK
ncbi:MAG: uridine phosphorylase [Elusimicrobia bacterium]|jgi:uridine phosphorylase|nr:uridine phosphorylase [Elusimicrobiota bacterium]